MKKAKEIVLRLGGKKSALLYCELKTHQKDILNNEIKYWNKIRKYIYECY